VTFFKFLVVSPICSTKCRSKSNKK